MTSQATIRAPALMTVEEFLAWDGGGPDGIARLSSIELELPVAEVYRDTLIES